MNSKPASRGWTRKLRVAAAKLPPGTPRVPETLSAAVAALRADRLLPQLLGEAFCSFWANTREWEWLMFNSTGGDPSATSTTDWELQRYFEIVG